ncbi:hypothetical protein ACFC09_07275 [Streptomyces sp. NPDC056161]|uniref:hypothetical protein n=1 Tax=Streptomyces sp. NPDC056161 TaxID=3345732 RepID=UPI0035DAC998
MPYDSYAVIRALVRAEVARTAIVAAKKPLEPASAPEKEPPVSSASPDTDDTPVPLSGRVAS